MDIKNTALIFAPINTWEAHEAITLEIILTELEQGNQVIRIQCESVLVTCPANKQHSLSKCNECRYRGQKTSAIIKSIEASYSEIWLRSTDVAQSDIDLDLYGYKFSELQSFNYDNFRFGSYVYGELISENEDIHLNEERDGQRAAELLAMSIQLYEWFLEQLSAHKIDKVYIWNGRRSPEAALAFAAKKLGVDVLYFNLGSKFNKYLLSKMPCSQIEGVNAEVRDWQKTRCKSGQIEKMKMEAETYFSSLRNGTSDIPHYENFMFGYSKSDLSQLKENNKRLLVIFTSSMWEYKTSPSLESLNSEFQNQYEIYRKIGSHPKIIDGYQIVFRWHPNLRKAGQFESLEVKRTIEMCPKVVHVLPDDIINSYSILDAAYAVITTGSTMGIEAAIAGKPSILLGIAPYQGLGSVYEPESFDELLRLLSRPIQSLPKEGAWAYGDWYRNFGVQLSRVQEKGQQYWIKQQRVHEDLSFLFRIRNKLREISLLRIRHQTL